MKEENRTSATGGLIGYARVSTSNQELALQLDALMEQGCQRDHIFIDYSSGAKAQRPGLDDCLRVLEEGDLLLSKEATKKAQSHPCSHEHDLSAPSVDSFSPFIGNTLRHKPDHYH
jgi:hypothetical protein